MRKAIIASVAFLSLSGATAAHASQYPPTPDDTLVDSGGPTTVADPPEGSLPQTGSDTSDSLMLGAMVLVTGTGLMVLARRRRTADNG